MQIRCSSSRRQIDSAKGVGQSQSTQVCVSHEQALAFVGRDLHDLGVCQIGCLEQTTCGLVPQVVKKQVFGSGPLKDLDKQLGKKVGGGA